MQAYASTANLPQQATKEKFFIEPLPYMKPVQIVIVVFSVVTLSLAAAWLSYINSYFDGGYSKLILYYDYKPMPYSLFCVSSTCHPPICSPTTISNIYIIAYRLSSL